MALYEYYCNACKNRFEELTQGLSENERGVCPKCQKNTNSERLISRFAVGGQGDLRESTMHGCHEHYDGLDHNHEH